MQNPESPKPIKADEQVTQLQQPEPQILTSEEQTEINRMVETIVAAWQGEPEGRVKRAITALDKAIFGEHELEPNQMPSQKPMQSSASNLQEDQETTENK
jgi:hypothetical protein